LRRFVPADMRERVISAAHTVGHVAYDATIHTLENFAYWPSFRKDTKLFIDKCLICKEKSSKSVSSELGDTPIPLHPWHTVGMDLLQLPVTKKGHKYLLVLVDLLTRYATAIPLIDKSARQVTSALKRFVFNDRLLGSPVILVSDNGLEFRNNSMTRLLGRHGIKQTCTTPYNPKANGTTERLNRTLLSLLRGALTPNIEWDTLIPVVLDIYNNCPHSSIGMSPYEAITGRPSRHLQLMPDTRATLLASTGPITLTEVVPPATMSRLGSRHKTRDQF